MTCLFGCLRLFVFAHVAISTLSAADVRTDTLPVLTCDLVRCVGPVEYVCRHVLPCPSCPIGPKCMIKSQIKKDIDRKCQQQNFSEVILEEDQNNSSVHTELKCSRGSPDWQCPFGSVCVRDGKKAVCCRGKMYQSNPPEKPGVCPIVGDFAACGYQPCKKDSDCQGQQKCCPSCGNLCSDTMNATELCGLVKCKPGEICLFRQPFCHDPEGHCTKLQFPRCMDPVCANCVYNELCIPNPSPFRDVECFPPPNCGGCPAGQVCTPNFDDCTPFQCPVFWCESEEE